MWLVRLGRGVRVFGAACAVVGVLLCCAQGAAALTACETPSPTIDKATLKEVTMAGVAVEAQINPQGTEATYEFLMVWRAVNASERGERIRGTLPAQGGRISAATGDVTVNAFLSGLQSGYTYWYEVVAANLGGEARYQAAPFAYLNPDWNSNGFLSGPPYVPPNRTGCEIESGDIAAARTVQEQREKEAAAKAEPPNVAAPAESCVVPDLRGRSPTCRPRRDTACSLPTWPSQAPTPLPRCACRNRPESQSWHETAHRGRGHAHARPRS